MTDQCKDCEFRGDFQACQGAVCSKHDDWHVVELKRRYEALKKMLYLEGFAQAQSVGASFDEARKVAGLAIEAIEEEKS